MKAPKGLKVTSHVGRDLLASAAFFKNEAVAVWEYVVNSLEYVERGVSPKIQVQVSPSIRRITVNDNGRGMSAADLHRFFTMHGENLDRLQGRPGRGKFGTGKSAAFGVANTLRVDTTRSGLRNVVTLTRDMIEKSGGDSIPLEWEVRDEKTSDQNGSTIIMQDIFLEKIRTAPIIEYIERHLKIFRAMNPEVAVNTHVCEYREPEIAVENKFKPSPEQAKVLGDIELIIKVARAPLPLSEQGIVVTAGHGNLIAVERGGVETKEFGSYLFGEIDILAIEESPSKIAPYDSSRSLQLNPEHPVVAVLVGFIGSKLEQVRGELVRDAKEARKTEQARRLALEGDKIADILNQDFLNVRERLLEIRAASSRPGATAAQIGKIDKAGEEVDVWIRGSIDPGVIETSHERGESGGDSGTVPPEIFPRGQRKQGGRDSVDPAGGSGFKKGRPRGGFRVEYKNIGRDEDRSRYDSSTLTILINLDNNVLVAALGEGNIEDPSFRRLSYEIAFSEYAMALGYEFLKQDPNISADDMLYEVRSSLNRVAGSAAILYR
jgi:hypothetical protein